MSKEKQAVLKIAGVFISTVIGAGFASGQEIVTFYSIWEEWPPWAWRRRRSIHFIWLGNSILRI